MCGPRALEAKLGGESAEASKALDGASCGSVRCMVYDADARGAGHL